MLPQAPGRLSPRTRASRSAGRSSSTRSSSAQKPRGMWPSEGSVCQAIIPAIAEAGIQWIATDEEILSCSTDGWVSRDGNGYLATRRCSTGRGAWKSRGRRCRSIFRDHAMSDQIGFHYQRYAPEHAVDDFVGKLEAIGNATGGNAGHRPTLVSIILDGENCWEYYPNAGVEFLRRLYRARGAASEDQAGARRATTWPAIRPPTSIGHLFPGSWIQHNFGIWIGHPECNRAWDLLSETRQWLWSRARRARKSKPADNSPGPGKNCTSPRGATGSGGSATALSSQDGLFDRLFRKHLQNVYTLLGEQPPAELPDRSAERRARLRPITEPTGLLSVKVDGRRDLFRVDQRRASTPSRQARGTMSMAESDGSPRLYFGFDTERLLLRFDAARPRPRAAGRRRRAAGRVLPAGGLRAGRHAAGRAGAEVAAVSQRRAGERCRASRRPADVILEIAVPFRSLARRAGRAAGLSMSSCCRQEQPIERVPHEGRHRNDRALARLRTDHVASVSREARRRTSEVCHARLPQRPDRRPLGDHRQEPGQTAARLSIARRSARRAASARSAKGNEDKTPGEIVAYRQAGTQRNREGWRVRVVPNKFPALEIEGELEQARRGHLRHDARRRRPRGDHRIARATW